MESQNIWFGRSNYRLNRNFRRPGNGNLGPKIKMQGEEQGSRRSPGG
jgi:hypothetical protein